MENKQNILEQNTRNRTIGFDTLSYIVVLLSLFSFSTLIGQEAEFYASADRTEVAVNGTFQITYTIANGKAKSFTPPNFTPFQSLGQSTSSSMNFINGKMSQSKSYIFTLRPSKEGSFKIPPAAAIIDGKNRKTNAVEINVVAASSNNSAGGNRQQNPAGGNTDIQQQIKENVLARVIPNKTTVYEGEQISLSYKMLYRVSLQDISILKSPSFDGFLSYEVELSQDKLGKKIDTYNGVRYNSSQFRQYAVFPTNAGSFTIEPIEIEAVVAIERQTRSWFPQIEHVKSKILSNPINVTVKPLPKDNRPTSFSGAVGKYDFSVEYDKTETSVDEPITLKVKVSGKGNIKLLDLPKVELPSSFEVYDPKIKEQVTKKSYQVGGSKTYEYLIIPRGGGEFQFPDLEFSYFDVETGKYVAQKYEGPVIKVEGEALQENTANGNFSREDVELLGTDIKYINTKPTLKDKSAKANLITKPLFHVLTWFPLLLAFFLPIVNKKRKEQQSDIVYVKSKKAHKEAKKRVAAARKIMTSGDDKTFYNEIVKSIWTYIGDKFNIETAELSKDKAKVILEENQVTTSTIEMATQLIDTCEMAIYAPSAINDAKETTLHKTETLILNIEKETAKKA